MCFYCVVVSYNIGVGNVVRIFIGRKSIIVVVDIINGMLFDVVYDFLMENLLV